MEQYKLFHTLKKARVEQIAPMKNKLGDKNQQQMLRQCLSVLVEKRLLQTIDCQVSICQSPKGKRRDSDLKINHIYYIFTLFSRMSDGNTRLFSRNSIRIIYLFVSWDFLPQPPPQAGLEQSMYQ